MISKIFKIRRNDSAYSPIIWLSAFFLFSIIASGTNSPLPFGDEAGYIGRAIEDNSNGRPSSNLYICSYQLILKFSRNDPVIAHYVMRSAVSAATLIAIILLLLSCLHKISYHALIFTLALWTSSYAVSPPAQFGNINLFAFSLALISAIPFIRNAAISRFFLLFTVLLWTSQIRPEYYLPLVFLLFYGIYRLIVSARFAEKKRLENREKLLIAASLFFLLASISYLAAFKEKLSEHSLSLCFGQHYATYYAKKHPEMKLSPMSEYQKLLKKTFDGKTGFFDILKSHPIDVLHYLCINGLKNSVIMIPAILRQRIFLFDTLPERKAEVAQLAFLSLLLLPGTIITLLKLRNTLPLRSLRDRLAIEGITLHKMIVLTIIASAVIIPLFLLIPDTRYYSPAAPIVLLYIYASTSILPLRIGNKVALILSVFLSILFCYPLFFRMQNNQHIVSSMRTDWKTRGKSSPPMLAGLFPRDIAIFAFGKNFVLEGENHFQTSRLFDKSYDYLVINKYFRMSSVWESNKELLNDFETDPEKYGYILLGNSQDKHQTTVYALKANTKISAKEDL